MLFVVVALVRVSVLDFEQALCTIRSLGTELIMLGRKLYSGTFKTKELKAVQVPLFCTDN